MPEEITPPNEAALPASHSRNESFTPSDNTSGLTPLFRAKPQHGHKPASWPTLLFGVLLPLFTFGIEATTRMCAEEFFDPMPTWWHHALVLAVPAGNFWVWWLVRRDAESARLTQAHRMVNGFVIGVALYYTLLYGPLLPLSVFAILIMGMGILPLTPIFALMASLFLTRHLRRLRAARHQLELPVPQRNPLAYAMLGFSFSCLLAGEAAEALTRYHLRNATAENSTASLSSVQWLRRYSSANTVLRACYGHTGDRMSLIGLLFNVAAPIDSFSARQVFYRMTGKSFETVEAPRLNRRWLDEPLRGFDDGTGETMSWMRPGLSLKTSHMDGSLDAQAGVSYLEWTMTFNNTSFVQQEARAHVALPPGGVVSRLTLWVNGEEREAAFAGRRQVQEAYENIVRQRRDPVLVTSAGPDRIQVQCFPVPPNGEMKIRFGITAPLSRIEEKTGWLRLPRLLERNFAIAPETKHKVWIEATHALASNTSELKAENPKPDLFALRGELPHLVLSKQFPSVQAERNAADTDSWTPDPFASNKQGVIVQRAALRPVNAPSRVLLLIDGSQGIATHAAFLADTLKHIPDEMPFKIMVAGDVVTTLRDWQPATPNARQAAANALRAYEFAGGTDNLAALAAAWDEANQKDDVNLVWIHAPQPVSFGTTFSLLQRFRPRPHMPQLYDLQTDNGPNLIAEAMDGQTAFRSLVRLGAFHEDLARTLREWRAVTQEWHFTRARVPGATTGAGKETSKHLARLWAKDEVQRMLDEPAPVMQPVVQEDNGKTKTPAVETPETRAIKLAAAYQIVTPVTGAVVLETQEQYERAGLTPVERQTVPTIPEPEVWALLIVALLTVAFVIWQRGSLWKLR